MFCKYCGTKKVPVPTGRFDEKTGEPTMKLVCPNVTHCHEACYEDGGHRWTRHVFKQNYCQRCGEIDDFPY